MCKTKREEIAFQHYIEQVAPYLQSTKFHKSYYRVLEAFASRKIKKLIVSIPPQHGKSLGASVLLPAYMLGLNPELRVAIASYSGTLANRFNRRVQRLIDSKEYTELFPQTTIKSLKNRSANSVNYIRTADQVEIIGYNGELMSVGREGSLTGNQVDIFILDDLYKDAMEANSPTIRENCWEWYTSVVKTRMHNTSSELIVFTRWHEEDLIGKLTSIEPTIELTDWKQIKKGFKGWYLLNFEAIKEGEPYQIDPRKVGAPLWRERHNLELLKEKQNLDPVRFSCMYQGKPSSAHGLLYGNSFITYAALPTDIIKLGNYTDTADAGDDYLCSISYQVDRAGLIYITDLVYSREPMEKTEPMVANMINSSKTRVVAVESNNGGKGFARAVARLTPMAKIEWFHQSGNKEARIISNSSTVMTYIRMPLDWRVRWSDLYNHITNYKREYHANRWHDAPDVLTGIVEREVVDTITKRIKAIRFSG